MFELFDVGREILNLPNAIKDEKDSKAAYPAEYALFNNLRQQLISRSVMQMRKIPRQLACIGDLQSGWNPKNYGRCGASVDPSRRTIKVFFVPTGYRFDDYPDHRALEFVARANNLLQVGSLDVSFARDEEGDIEGFGFVYSIKLVYESVAQPNVTLLSNMVSNVINSSLFLPPAVEAFSNKILPEDAADLMRGKVKPPAAPLLGRRDALAQALLDFLTTSQVSYSELPEGQGYEYSTEEQSGPLRHTIYVSPYSKLAFFTTLDVEIPFHMYQRTARYLAIINKHSPVFRMSHLILDYAHQRVSLQTSIDCYGLEDKIDTVFLALLGQDNILGSRIAFLGMSAIINGEGLQDVIKDFVMQVILPADSNEHPPSPDEYDGVTQDDIVKSVTEGFFIYRIDGTVVD